MAKIEERKAQYEKSALKQLMEAAGHEVCERCYCCDAVWEVANCWACGGFPESDDDDWPRDACSECGGEGEISYRVCLGRCDKDGNHKQPAPQPTDAIATQEASAEGCEKNP